MRGLLITTKKELKEIIKNSNTGYNTQFTIKIEKQQDYYHIKED